ncbi:ribosomal RNA-processing protein 9 [Diutina catenulata]
MADSFLQEPKRKRSKPGAAGNTSKRSKPSHGSRRPGGAARPVQDEEISSGSDDDEQEAGSETPEAQELDSDEEFAGESAADKRRRLAKQYIENLQTFEYNGDEFDAKDLDNDLIAKRLQVDVAEQEGDIYKFIGTKVGQQLDSATTKRTRMGGKWPTGVSVHYPYVYTVAKDGELVKYKMQPRGGLTRVKFTSTKHANDPLVSRRCPLSCVAASAKFVVTGTAEGQLIIWSSENLTCLKVMNTRGAVLSMAFRRGTDQLYAACADLKIRTFSINQFQQLEVLYGHQDAIVDISAMSRETCVSVGSRDKTAMFWKIADESRLTFRGGDSVKRTNPDTEFFEGSIDCVSMLDESHFVTGADNGNLSLWSLNKKKPQFTQRIAHGVQPALEPQQASAEQDSPPVPPAQPYWITAVHAVPFSDMFISGSFSGEIKVWKVDAEGTMRSFELVGSVAVPGCVVEIASCEFNNNKTLEIVVLASKEHRLGRWLQSKISGRNQLVTVVLDL